MSGMYFFSTVSLNAAKSSNGAGIFALLDSGDNMDPIYYIALTIAAPQCHKTLHADIILDNLNRA